MRIGIWTKFSMAGGSEFRAVELANSIRAYSSHESFIFTPSSHMPDKVKERINQIVPIITDVFSVKETIEMLYTMDTLLVINTDSQYFTKVDYWEGKTDQQKSFVDLTKIKQMVYLFNFIVSPARHLAGLSTKCPDVRIMTTNKRFFDELSYKDKHEFVRHIPRMILESPIDPHSVSQEKTPSDKIRIGKHSKGMESKWCIDHVPLIQSINKDYGDKVIWDFMGTSGELKNKLRDIPNVTLRDEFTKPVKEYLQDIDIFLFYITYDRQEPFARVVGEGMASGCPILATDVDGGNRMQVIHGNNGYLCENTNDFYEKIIYLIKNPERIKQMGKNSILLSKFFSSEFIIKKFLMFIE